MKARTLMFAPIVLLAACATTVSVPPALEQTAWTLSPPASGALAKSEAASITLEFKDGRVSGHGGCNQYNGTYTLENTTLTVGPVAATKRGCMGDANAVEKAWFETLREPLFAAIVDGRLRLTGKDGQTLEFTKKP